MKDQQPERLEIERVAASREFSRAPQLQRLLRWLCDRKLAGDTASLTEHAIGTGPLGRKDDFDPRIDTIVRKEMGRLRAKLDDFYKKNGQAGPLRIVLEKGSYEPAFVFPTDPGSQSTTPSRILVLPFTPSGRATHLHFTEDLVDLLIATPGVQVAPQLLADHCRQQGIFPLDPLRKAGVDWLIEGTLHQGNGEPTASVRLIDTSHGFAIASWRLHGSDLPQRAIASVIAAIRRHQRSPRQ